MKLLKIIFFLFFTSSNLFANTSYFNEGLIFYENKEFDKAKFKFEQDIVFNPKNEKSYLYLAKIYKLEDNDEFQEQNLNTVILLNPKNEEAVYLLALLKIKQSDYKKSKDLINVLSKICKNFCSKENELNGKLKNLQPK